MLKTLALNLLLALGSVSAASGSHESRGVAHHEERGFTPSPSCPSDQKFDRIKWKCVCKNPDQTVKTGETSCSCPTGEKIVGQAPGTACITDCGSQARFVPSKGLCVCYKSYLTYNTDKTCSCAPEKKDTGSGCVNRCTGSKAAWVVDNSLPDKGSCSCTAGLPGATYSDSDGCTCPDGTKLNAAKTKCVPDCGSKATLMADEATCACNAPGASYSAGTCTCTDPNKYLNAAGTKCVPVCGNEASLNSAETGCECNIKGADFNSGSKTCSCPASRPNKSTQLQKCIPECGPQAHYDSGLDACDCNAPGASFSTSTKTCSCPNPDKPVLNASGTKCTPRCGTNARLKANEDECECSIAGATLHSNNACSCDDADKPIANSDKNKCVPDCGDDANLNTEGTECNCKATSATFVKSSKSCVCPTTGDKMKLNAAHDDCVYDCGSQGKVKGDSSGCECKADGATWDKDQQTCDCGSSADLAGDSSKCNCKLQGATFTPSGQSCACPSDAPSKMKPNSANTQCVLDCGSAGGSLNDDASACECKKPNSHFDATQLTCECDTNFFPSPKGACISDCGSDATYKSGGCVCNKKGQVFTDDGNTKSCACPTAGDVWTDGSCHADCGSEAHWDKKSSQCTCDKKGKTFNAGVCSCDDGYKYDGSTCVKNCGDDATYNTKTSQCVCNAKTKVFTEAAAPAYGTCACADTDVWNGSKCVLDCGPDASLSGGKCVCDKRGMTWTAKTCACDGGMTWDAAKRRCPAAPSAPN
ncbi:hypothetical protein FDECE_14488 [Fusarium decemcellulare]|nr:hypothetical protein FDECE_14488 [Fusarium decemcellulare]